MLGLRFRRRLRRGGWGGWIFEREIIDKGLVCVNMAWLNIICLPAELQYIIGVCCASE
jgi:hypothetical protein